MARKSKRKTLNEAIRQGQAKIAEGLKTGQMRSDGPSAQKAEKDRRGLSGSENTMRSPNKGGAALLRSKEKSTMGSNLSSNTKLILLLCVVGAFMVIWVAMALVNSGSAKQPNVPAANPENQSIASEERREPVQNQDPDQTSREIGTEPLPPVVSTGDNVIVILTIESDRMDKLRPVADFFRGKGIETEIITVSGKSGLVTKAGFEQNPASRGTDGYELFQRIKQLGTVYVEETGDTQFKQKPFQDIYGYKR